MTIWAIGGPLHEDVVGMPLEGWRTMGGDCVAHFGVGDDWATLYDITSQTEGKGQATALLIEARKHYELLGKRFGSSVALNSRMRAILRRLQIREYK